MNAAWDRAFPDGLHDGAGRRTVQRMRLGLTALTTPPWAQDIGTHPDPKDVLSLLEAADCPLTVLDLPPGSPVDPRPSAQPSSGTPGSCPSTSTGTPWTIRPPSEAAAPPKGGHERLGDGRPRPHGGTAQASRDRKGLSSDEGALSGFSVSCCRNRQLRRPCAMKSGYPLPVACFTVLEMRGASMLRRATPHRKAGPAQPGDGSAHWHGHAIRSRARRQDLRLRRSRGQVWTGSMLNSGRRIPGLSTSEMVHPSCAEETGPLPPHRARRQPSSIWQKEASRAHWSIWTNSTRRSPCHRAATDTRRGCRCS